MTEIELTDEDMAIIYSRTAIAAFINAVSLCSQKLGEYPDGAFLEDSLLKAPIGICLRPE